MCKPEYYGLGCNLLCDCANKTCDTYDGTCSNVCRDGYVKVGSNCVRCSDFRQHCEECSAKYNCTRCASGYNLYSSDDVTYCCSPDMWGEKCQYNCSSDCFDTACDVTNGHCIRCSKYTYGDTCQFRCSGGCNDGNDSNVCGRQDGNCRHGCKPGFIGKQCNRVDGQWGQWSSYEPCSVTCGIGSRSRRRSCDNPAPQNGGQSCRGRVVETNSCNLASCQGDGQWGQWSGYGPCSVTCGLGTRSSTRSCDSPPPQYGGEFCIGNNLKTKRCDQTSCPVNGHWSHWSELGPCSVTCGRGSRSRSRSCDNPASQNGGQPCNGTDSQETGCSMGSCPIDGNWDHWSEYRPCSVTCGEGSMSRSRSCDQPSPQNGGRQCVGSGVEITSCIKDNCTNYNGENETDAGNTEKSHNIISGDDVRSSNVNAVGGVIGSAVLIVAVGIVLLVILVIKRRIQRGQHKNHKQAVYVNVNPSLSGRLGTEANGLNVSNYECLQGQPQQNPTYTELQPTAYENLKI